MQATTIHDQSGTHQAATGERTTWSIVAGSHRATYTAHKRYFMLIPMTVKGWFDDFSGTITMAGDDPLTAEGTFQIPVASHHSGMAKRDTHMASADFFNEGTHPNISFSASGLREMPGTPGHYEITGTLTAGGVSRPVTFTGSLDNLGTGQMHVAMEATIDRRDFDMTWERVPLLKLIDQVALSVTFDIESA